jgi:NAD+ diphosphatase
MSASKVVQALPFTGATLDRADTLRTDPELVAAAAASREARLVAAGLGDVALDAGEPRLLRVPADGRLDPSTAVLLGLESGVPLFGVDLERLDESRRAELLAGARRATLREAGMELSQSEGGLAAYLSALLNWHRTHGFCANCGAPTAIADAGVERRCGNCGAHHFPRTDPVVIMLVENDDRILMGSRSGAPEGRYSVLAGFVSPGETPEDAVIREVWEEARIDVHDPRYVAAQPWPFPASLMLGFEARSDSGEPVIGDGELDDVRWFPREEIAAASRGEAWFQLPGEVSIARTLIERWLARG